MMDTYDMALFLVVYLTAAKTTTRYVGTKVDVSRDRLPLRSTREIMFQQL